MKTSRFARITCLVLSVLMLVAVMSACGGKKASADDFDVAKYDWATEAGSDKYDGRTLSILLTIGGGGNYYEPVAKRMMEYYPGLTVELNYTQGAADVLRTQILADNAPDIFNCNAGDLPYYDAIAQEICAPIDAVFDVPTLDGSKKLGDLMDDGLFSIGEVEGKHYVMHDMLYMDGLWYDSNFFAANNLTVPTDWASLQKLAEECDALGMDVLGSCGLMSHEYPTCYWWWPMVASTDYQTYTDLQNLKADAFKGDGMKAVVDKMLYLRDNGYYNTATNGLGNAETQMSFINHDFALLPCGSWLEAEMADAWTEDWQLTYLPYSFGDEVGDEYMRIDSLASMISTSTENMDLVCEFYRFLFSDEASLRGSTAVHTNVYKIAGFADVCGDLLAPSVQDASAKGENMKTINTPAGIWYTALNPEIGNMIVGLMGGDIDGDEFMERGYNLFKGVADDSAVTKYTFAG